MSTKPGAAQRRWQAEHASVVKALRKMLRDIDSLGDGGVVIASWRVSIEGTLSLLEELWQRCVSNGGTGR